MGLEINYKVAMWDREQFSSRYFISKRFLSVKNFQYQKLLVRLQAKVINWKRMGNEESCCVEVNKDNEIEEMKNSVKYAKRITKLSRVDQFETISQSLNNKSEIHGSEKSEYSGAFYRVSSDKQMQNFQQQQANRKDKQNELQQELLVKEQIQLEYRPIVKRLIDKLKPFQQQFSEINPTRIRTVRVNSQRDVYKGQVDNLSRPHGLGALVKQNGNVLIGGFVHGNAQGRFYYIFADGSYYLGKMVDNEANDENGEFHSLQISYMGGFRGNRFHGQGKQVSEEYCFEGQYENSLKKHGMFKWGLDSRNKNIQLRQDQQNEQEQCDRLPPSRNFQSLPHFLFQYEGHFDQQQRFTGKGHLKQPNGEYDGEFNSGKKHGKGQYRYKSGLRYVGEYVNGKKSGYGVLYNCDETIAYEGSWKGDLPDGKGCSYDLEGRRHESEFIQGISRLIAPQGYFFK